MSTRKLISRVGVALVLLCSTLSFAAEPQAAQPATIDNTSGVLVFATDGVPQVVVFVSKTGHVTALSVGACIKDPKCVALANAEHKAGRAYVLNVRHTASGGTSV
jgi:hypothetical protein